MSLLIEASEAQPLLASLRELVVTHDEALARAEELIGAVAAGNVVAVNRLVAAQTSALSSIESAERRRSAAEATLVALLNERGHHDGTPRTSVSSSELLDLFPPSESEQLRRVRHDLLTALVRLQATNRQVGMLLSSARAVINRLVCATIPEAVGYGPRGDLARPRADGRRRAARLA